jgi:ABC-type phosphate transport system substrate-binding protein
VLIFSSVAKFPSNALAGDLDYQVVVNRSDETSVLERKALANMFLKRITAWENSKIVLPVDLTADAPARKSFTEEILSRSVPAVRMYWQQLLFSGRAIPPPELKSDQDVIDFVSAHVEAIGYVSGRADVHRVRVVQVKE